MVISGVWRRRSPGKAIGLMKLVLSLARTIIILAFHISGELLLLKNWSWKTKLWPLLMAILFGVLVNVPYVHGIPAEISGTTLDFETGDLRGWTIYHGYFGDVQVPSTAFDFQPTLGDNPTARKRGQPSMHQGKYWIGTYEKYQGLLRQTPGDIQGDEPVGYIESPYFNIPSGTLSFLVGGGSSYQTRVELVIPVDCGLESCPDKTLLFATGQDTETMSRVTWDLNPYAGERGRIRIVDASSGPWGHINVDDFVFQPDPPPTISISSPYNKQEFDTNTINVSGDASDNAAISKVEVSVNAGSWQLASGTTSWSTSVTLNPGSNTILARATDTYGNTAENSIMVIYKNLPAVSISSPSAGETLTTNTITVNGTASDSIGVSRVEVSVNSGSWQLASGTTSWSTSVTLNPGSNKILARATNTHGNAAENSVMVVFKTLPTISISSPSAGETLTTNTITVSGTASDSIGVSRVEVSVNSGSWQLASGTTSWSKSVTLNQGMNTIKVRATDTSGNIAETSVPANFEPFEWEYIIEIFGAIAALVVFKYLYSNYLKPSPQQPPGIEKQLPVKIETRGGIESTYESGSHQYRINVEARGGIERYE
jgi:hypothetical protein